jgi:trigger factor
MQERNAMVVEKKDGTVAKDDIVTINYCELDDNGNKIEGTDREDFVFTVGSGENLFKIDDDIIGMKKGETKEKYFASWFFFTNFATIITLI